MYVTSHLDGFSILTLFVTHKDDLAELFNPEAFLFDGCAEMKWIAWIV